MYLLVLLNIALPRLYLSVLLSTFRPLPARFAQYNVSLRLSVSVRSAENSDVCVCLFVQLHVTFPASLLFSSISIPVSVCFSQYLSISLCACLFCSISLPVSVSSAQYLSLYLLVLLNISLPIYMLVRLIISLANSFSI